MFISVNITILRLTNPDVNLKRMHQLYNVEDNAMFKIFGSPLPTGRLLSWVGRYYTDTKIKLFSSIFSQIKSCVRYNCTAKLYDIIASNAFGHLKHCLFDVYLFVPCNSMPLYHRY